MKTSSLSLALLALMSGQALATDVINHKSPIAVAAANGVNTCKRKGLPLKKCGMTT